MGNDRELYHGKGGKRNRFAGKFSAHRGLDVDKPRNLAKSVTVE